MAERLGDDEFDDDPPATKHPCNYCKKMIALYEEYCYGCRLENERDEHRRLMEPIRRQEALERNAATERRGQRKLSGRMRNLQALANASNARMNARARQYHRDYQAYVARRGPVPAAPVQAHQPMNFNQAPLGFNQAPLGFQAEAPPPLEFNQAPLGFQAQVNFNQMPPPLEFNQAPLQNYAPLPPPLEFNQAPLLHYVPPPAVQRPRARTQNSSMSVAPPLTATQRQQNAELAAHAAQERAEEAYANQVADHLMQREPVSTFPPNGQRQSFTPLRSN